MCSGFGIPIISQTVGYNHQRYRRFHLFRSNQRMVNHHRYMNGLFKHTAFPPKAMIPHLLAVVTGIDNRCILQQIQLLKGIQKNPDSLVQRGDCREYPINTLLIISRRGCLAFKISPPDSSAAHSETCKAPAHRREDPSPASRSNPNFPVLHRMESGDPDIRCSDSTALS